MPRAAKVQTPIPIPMTARVGTTAMERTYIEFDLFDNVIVYPVGGARHEEDAARIAGAWNALFAREWETVQKTSEAIMLQFSDALRAEGVGDVVIDRAMNAVAAYVKS